MRQTHALVYAAPGLARLEKVDLPDLRPGMVEVETRFSGLSRGTERLIFQGGVPRAEWDRMRAPHQVGEFPFPVRYGYASVGRLVVGPPALLDRDVFCLYPHQSRFRVPLEAVVVIPHGVPAGRAVLAANMETALNAVWDARPSPGARCLVVGAGLVGSLVTSVLSRRNDLSVHVTDVRPDPVVKAFDDAVRFVSPSQIMPGEYDLTFHTSASDAGLQTAIDALDFEGTLVELSWYGDRPVNVRLGGNFHANRLRILSSQVGRVAPSHRGALDFRGRLTRALELLTDDRLDHLITSEVAFRDLADALPGLLGDAAPGIATRVVY